MLSSEQLKQYTTDGYIVLRHAIPQADIQRLEQGVANNPPLDGTLDPNAPQYPNPGRYTLATQCLKDPDLAFIVEHPQVVEPVQQILGEQPKLTAYVIYDRTPAGKGLPAHHDYKRWRPVGSSLHWLFTVIPFNDFDEQAGPLYVAPRSHRLNRVMPGNGPCLEVAPAVKPQDEDFVDPKLRRGDLLLMNMHLWHKADDNRSDKHRVGLFNKYAAASFPPATGYFLFDDEVANALSDEGQKLLAVHSNLPLATTRAVLIRYVKGQPQMLLCGSSDNLSLPGGETWDERAIPDWDRGNMIAPLQQHLRQQIHIELPWLSYIGDYQEGEGLCRTYGYTLNDHGFPVAYDATWVDLKSLDHTKLANGWELQAAHSWLDPNIKRGKGLSQAQCRIDQFAY